MSRNMNPPIKGHALLNEGHSVRISNNLMGTDVWSEGCECGAKPAQAQNVWVSINAMKRWHRAHKDELRGQS